MLNRYAGLYIYYHPSVQNAASGFFGFLANLALYGRLIKNEATGQVGGYGFGQVLTKNVYFSIEHTPRYHRLRGVVVVARASEQTH